MQERAEALLNRVQVGAHVFVGQAHDPIAAKHCVDFFFPIGVPDFRAGVNAAVDFNQDATRQVGEIKNSLPDVRLATEVRTIAIESA